MARILLVDDEEDVRAMLSDGLRLAGHQVDVAASAEEALTLARQNSYEVAILDYLMPGKRGLELLHDLRRIHQFLRSIIITGQVDHDVLDAHELERQLKERILADRYIPKPASMDSLTRAIDEVLRPAAAGDWQRLAADAVAAQEVKPKDVKQMDRTMRKARKKK